MATACKTFLMCSAMGLTLSVSANAQVAGQKEALQTSDAPVEVVVTGFRASNRAAIRSKKDAEMVVDAVSQDDIGRLPDLNVVESSRRITGLSTVGGLDPTKNRDIYQRVTIRGLDPKYNLITIDGTPLASSEWTVRGARMDQLPASLLSRIEAIKTVSAEYDPHALGGQLNLVTKSAFAIGPKRFLSVNAFAGQNTTSGQFIANKKPNLRVDATAAARFGAREQFGLIVSAEYQNLNSSVFSELPGDTAGAGWTYYTASGAATPFRNLSSTGYAVPVRVQDFAFDNERSRASLNAKLEYRFNETDSVSLFAGHYYDKDEELRAEVLTVPAGAPTGVTATSGQFASGDLQQGIVFQPQTRKTNFINLKGDFALTPDLDLKLGASVSDSTYNEQRVFQKWAGSVPPGRAATSALPAFGYSYTITDGFARSTHVQPTLGNDPAQYKLLYIRDVYRDSASDVSFLKAELGWNVGEGDTGWGARFGLNQTRTRLDFDIRYKEWTSKDAASQTAIGGMGAVSYPNRFSTRTAPQLNYIVLDTTKVLNLLTSRPEWFVETNRVNDNFQDDFTDVETVKAAYAQAIYRGQRLTLIAGLRRDNTNVEVSSWQRETASGATVFTRRKASSDYNYVLPSVLATWNLSDVMRLRAGFSQTIGRPDFPQYAARTTFSVSTSNVLTVNTGNPDLKPREADNYDFSYEWYLPKSGLVSAALFRKDLKNEIFNGTQAGPATAYQGVTYQSVVINQPLNAKSGDVQGLELSYVQNQLPFLPDALEGLGLSANATWLEGGFDLPMSAASVANGGPQSRRTSGLIQQPDYIFNLSAFYARGPLETRVSFNRIGQALQSVDQDTPERDLYQMARDQIDLQMRYEVRKGLDVIAQVQNLTEEAFEVRQGRNLDLVNNYFPVGRTVWLGLSWKPSF